MIKRVISIWLSLAMVIGFVVIVDVITDYTHSVLGATTRYVNETGSDGAYTSIQDAINASSDGDTVFVYTGTYYENVAVNKTINLTGEDKGTTIIDGLGNGDVVKVVVDWVNITGFSVQNSSTTGFPDYDAGIDLNYVQNCRIFNNEVTLNKKVGIFLYYSTNNNISFNTATSNAYPGIYLYESDLNEIYDNDVSINSQGIHLYYSNNNTVISNTADANDGHGIYLVYSNDNDIIGNLATNQVDYDGFSLSRSHRNNIINNSAIDNDDGMYVSLSDENVIKDNYVYSQIHGGISISRSHENQVLNNTITGNMDGLHLGGSNHTLILNNTINNDRGEAIFLMASSENVLRNNTMSHHGILMDGSRVENWNAHHIDTSNTVKGKPVYYFKNQTSGSVPSDAGEVILGNCTGMTVEGLELLDCGIGIVMGFSYYNNILNNNISFNKKGFHVSYADLNNFTDNVMHDNTYGFYLSRSYKNDFFNNTITWSLYYGISLYRSEENLIHENKFISNGWSCVRLFYSDDNYIIDNDMSPNNGPGVTLDYADYNLISHNNFSRNLGRSIDASDSWYNIISDNIISSNSNEGIHFYHASRNTITRNNIYDNTKEAIAIYGSCYTNKIYHNNIINNTGQAKDVTDDGNQWHNGYPSGGNYWSDYTGLDLNRTPDQDVPPPDGIGDTAYVIDLDSQDNYPLMHPIENYTILNQGWNLISLPLIQEDQNLTKVLEKIDGYYDTVEWYNISDAKDSWKVYSVNKPYGNDLTELNETMGFWIYIIPSGGAILLHDGTQPKVNQTITLHPGWNLVGYPSQTSCNRTQGLNSLTFGTHVESIWTFDAANQKWEELGPTDYFEPGKGYWINGKVKCEWEVPL